MLQFLNVLQYIVLTLWVGSMFGFGALVAPVLFRSLPSRDQAGSMAGEIIARIESLGLVTGGIMLVVTALQAIDGQWQALDLLRLLLSAVMLGVVLLSSISFRQRLEAVRQKMGKPIDEVSEEDPDRVEYNKYHRLSRALFSLNMVLGAVLIVLSALR